MIKIHKLLATCMGIGYVGKGGGTLAAVAACFIWYFTMNHLSFSLTAVVVTLVVIAYGVLASSALEPGWGKDSSKIVIDEVAGMFITLLFVPVSIINVAVGLVLFRFFDIAKPLFIRRLEDWPKGWGVMGDDVLAGIYANILLQVLVYARLW